ncbi:Non-heme bromoperoxidase BPO-A1 [Actinomadura rubteroloni]|uniref:Non-heme bromoperoxidase BPO-A1 n=1 Tax=Actinomadura rubteroloni TaxID=1926885 RepID=A0A2P4UQV9_9ACTN|nr:alpha/beta hydrolase [Actinomadura rubteroloni]POM27414.1 Non-heme bromoperoxidase BPO-A1 [Actinomadura rubteroloni]
MGFVTTRDGTEIYYHDWGSGPPVLFSHGWPLNADAWQDQMKAVADAGYRAIAHDRRGHGRSSQPYGGYDFDTFADDLSDLIEALDLKGVSLVGHSMGGGEITRYIGRYGTGRVGKAVLLSAIPPLLVQTESNPEGVPKDVLEGLKDGILHERSQFWLDLADQFYGANRPGSDVTGGNKYAFWLMAMQENVQAGVACVDAFASTDFTEDLRRFDVPTLIVHGDDDQIVPIDATARKAAEIVSYANLTVYEGGSHGMASVPGYKERFNRDLLDFLGS